MDNNIDLNVVRGKSVMVGTPMYGGMSFANYFESMMRLSIFCAKENIKLGMTYITSESLIARGRNEIVKQFLDSDYDYLFFIDGDISFDHIDFIHAVYLAATNDDKQIIVGPYPHKTIVWDRIQKAKDLGLIKQESDYMKYSGRYGINFYGEKREISLTNPVEIKDGSTGFMLIAREVFEKFYEAYPEQKYVNAKTEEPMFAYFDCKIDEIDNTYLSEDYFFTRWANKIGYKTWLMPWVKLQHMGSMLFTGSFIDFAVLNKAIDDEQLK
jgi:GT2 family glycosyltransferase